MDHGRQKPFTPPPQAAPTFDPQLLHDLHLLDRNGRVQADRSRKTKQIQHLLQLLQPLLARHPVGQWIEAGAGKGTLGLLFYSVFLKNTDAELTAIESHPSLSEKMVAIATERGFHRFYPWAGDLQSFARSERFSVIKNQVAGVGKKTAGILALHACDRATDQAVRLGLDLQASLIVIAPCCQAELSAKFSKSKTGSVRPLWEYPLHRREMGALLTNWMRVKILEMSGYRVTVTEFVGWEHSMKNELILAEKISDYFPQAREELFQVLREFSTQPDELLPDDLRDWVKTRS